jgi:hypothetical protein
VRWSVRKRDGQWRVYDRGFWHDSFDTLVDAHTYATQCAVADVLYEPGGLTWLRKLERWAGLYCDITYLSQWRAR